MVTSAAAAVRWRRLAASAATPTPPLPRSASEPWMRALSTMKRAAGGRPQHEVTASVPICESSVCTVKFFVEVADVMLPAVLRPGQQQQEHRDDEGHEGKPVSQRAQIADGASRHFLEVQSLTVSHTSASVSC